MTYIRNTEEEQLTDLLRSIRDQQFEVPNDSDPYELVNKILDHLGSPDPELRDQLGYRILSKWIYVKNRLSAAQLKEILARCTSDEMLFDQIGDQGSENVLLRSFSTLVIALVLLRDNEDLFLSEKEFRHTMDRLVTYAKDEQDLRGFIPEYGWAHAAAHVSDALDECVKSRYATVEDCAYIWGGLKSLIVRAKEVYGCEEDERIAVPIIAMVESGKVSIPIICEWIAQEAGAFSSSVEDMVTRTNWKHLIRSLFFQLKKQSLLHDSEENFIQLQERFS